MRPLKKIVFVCVTFANLVVTSFGSTKRLVDEGNEKALRRVAVIASHLDPSMNRVQPKRTTSAIPISTSGSQMEDIERFIRQIEDIDFSSLDAKSSVSVSQGPVLTASPVSGTTSHPMPIDDVLATLDLLDRRYVAAVPPEQSERAIPSEALKGRFSKCYDRAAVSPPLNPQEKQIWKVWMKAKVNSALLYAIEEWTEPLVQSMLADMLEAKKPEILKRIPRLLQSLVGQAIGIFPPEDATAPKSGGIVSNVISSAMSPITSRWNRLYDTLLAITRDSWEIMAKDVMVAARKGVGQGLRRHLCLLQEITSPSISHDGSKHGAMERQKIRLRRRWAFPEWISAYVKPTVDALKMDIATEVKRELLVSLKNVPTKIGDVIEVRLNGYMFDGKPQPGLTSTVIQKIKARVIDDLSVLLSKYDDHIRLVIDHVLTEKLYKHFHIGNTHAGHSTGSNARGKAAL